MVRPRHWLRLLDQLCSSPSLRFACYLVVARLTVLWSSPERYWDTLPEVVLALLLYELIAGGYVREFRGWYAATYFPSVDLQQLCDSYRGKGEMNLPRELSDKILRYNGDLRTLKSCSLTSRAFYSAARPLIHRRMELGVASVARGSRSENLPRDVLFAQAEVFHARYLSMVGERGLLRHGYVRELHLELSIGNPENVLQLRQVRALETVHTLTINSLDLPQMLPIFDRCFSQFVPTLRSLGLHGPRCENAHQLIDFVCRFPYLDDLELTSPLGPDDGPGLADAPPGSKGHRPQQPLPFGGNLVLKGGISLVQCLLDLPGDIRFRSIETIDVQKDLEKLVVACSSTLEVLSISCYGSFYPPGLGLRGGPDNWGSGETINISLGCNEVFRRFELQVNFAELHVLPPFLHKTLAPISSPHFSEFSLLLRQDFVETKTNGGATRRRVWGTGWEVVDEVLCACAARRDGFRFTVEIVTGQSTRADVEAHFPRMKAKGSLLVTQRQPRW